MRIAAVIEYPDRGAFAPVKYGTRHGDFLKTSVEGVAKEIWILDGRVYDLANSVDVFDFNKDCVDVISHCQRRKMRVTARVITEPKPKLEKPYEKKAPKKEAVMSLPKPITPPSGG